MTLRRQQLLAGAGAALLALGLFLTPIGKGLDRLWFDSLFLLRGARVAPDRLAIVAVDEPSFAELELQWPWPRSVHARLLDSLFAAGASAVGFDILFPEASQPHEDAVLAAALQRHAAVVLAADVNVIEESTYTRQTLVRPAPVLGHDPARVAAVNLPSEGDGFVREVALDAGPLPAMALALARIASDGGCCPATLARVRERYDGRLTLNYFGPPRSLPTVSYYQALAPADYLPPGFFAGKTVLVGLATQSASDPRAAAPDHYPTPYTRGGAGYSPGVEIHATALLNLLDEGDLRPLPAGAALTGGLVLGLLGAVAFVRLRPLPGAALCVALILGVSISSLLLFGRELYLPLPALLLPVVAAFSLSPFFHYFAEARERRFIHRTFDSYLNPSVVAALAAHPEMLRPGGKQVTGSVLFLDVADFTTLSENYPPETLIEIINRFLGAMADIVMRHEGMIDKFIGDAVMAAWGAPLPQPDHAVRACDAALEMTAAMDCIAEREQQLTGARLGARIGINSGDMLAGNIGGTRRFDYTVHGNEVNTASRIEGANKIYGTHLLIGENTAQQVTGRFELRRIDRVLLKGKHIPIDVFELLGGAGSLDPARREAMQCYAGALQCYRERDWARARRGFEQVLRICPDDGPGHTLAARCREFERANPGADWDGVFVVTTK